MRGGTFVSGAVLGPTVRSGATYWRCGATPPGVRRGLGQGRIALEHDERVNGKRAVRPRDDRIQVRPAMDGSSASGRTSPRPRDTRERGAATLAA
jgi:hypothetical protein